MGAAWGRGADRGIENLLCIASIMWELITILAQHMNHAVTTFAQYLEGLALEGCRFPHNSNEVPTHYKRTDRTLRK